MPLSEKVRIEIFIPDLPDLIYRRLLDQLGDELSYAFGGCSINSTSGKYRSISGSILPDDANVLFSDAPFQWNKDRHLIEQYAQGLQDVVQKALDKEEAILIAVYPVYHSE